MLKNIVLLSDSYKISHHSLYPKGLTNLYSYFESRGGEFDEIVFFGLRYYIRKYLFGQKVTTEYIDEAQEYFSQHFGRSDVFNRANWEYIRDVWHGYLPIRIKAIDEGVVLAPHNALLTIENVDPNCAWLTNYLETILCQLWYPVTVCSQSRAMKKILLKYLEFTGTPETIDFKLHDFGFRGVTCPEQAAIGGAAHLVNFKGTDTFPAIELLKEYYREPMAGFSIPATEHSTITSWGQEHELDAMRNTLEKYPSGLVACVSDSFDIYKACEIYWGEDLKEQVLQRDGVLVIRPDSGNPARVLPNILKILHRQFGAERNNKGFLVLNPKVRIIQGDGVELKTLPVMLDAVTNAGYSADNIAFGSGGGLLQKVNRDTCKFAFKASAGVIDGREVDIFKSPVTDSGKRSKRGRLKVIRKTTGEYRTESCSDYVDLDSFSHLDELKIVLDTKNEFGISQDLGPINFQEIRNRAAI